jgi:hypothetical protein
VLPEIVGAEVQPASVAGANLTIACVDRNSSGTLLCSTNTRIHAALSDRRLNFRRQD